MTDTVEAEEIANCVCANLRQATRVVTQLYDDALRSSGLTASQFHILSVLERVDKAPLSKLAEILVVDRTTLTRNLRPLIRRGLVQTESGTDQRVRELSLTETGARLRAETQAHWQGIQQKLTGQLGPEGFSGLIGALNSTLKAAKSIRAG